MSEFLKAALTNLWWPFIGGVLIGAICAGIGTLARRRHR